jgi:hypothetical protein
VDENASKVTVSIEQIDTGMSGFVIHEITPEHTSILKNAVVESFDKESKMATIKMSEFNLLSSSALPSGKWKVKVGDFVQLAFGYSRAILIAPTEEIYHKISKSVKTQWIHPDIFAAILSYNGHPTPLKEDFDAFSDMNSVGLLFLYLDKRVYTLDIKTFKILSITDTPIEQDTPQLPFYSRIKEIDANWFGEGSDRLQKYEPYYYELLVRFNDKDKRLYEILKNSDGNLSYLLKEFKIGE